MNYVISSIEIECSEMKRQKLNKLSFQFSKNEAKGKFSKRCIPTFAQFWDSSNTFEASEWYPKYFFRKISIVGEFFNVLV